MKQAKTDWRAFRSAWGYVSKLLVAVAMLCPCTAQAQQPVVNANHSATFTLKAPGAKKMVLVLANKKYKMERQGDTFT